MRGLYNSLSGIQHRETLKIGLKLNKWMYTTLVNLWEHL